MQPGSDNAVMIPGPAGLLEGVWSSAEKAADHAAVICHPHPLHGGTMNNKVVTTLARVFRDAGLPVLRFNFRGTGASEGLHDQGRGEIDDLLAVLAWLRGQHGIRRVSLAGFSFGAWVATAVTARWPADLALERLILVAPPVHYDGFDRLHPPANTLVLVGDMDEVVDPEAMQAWALSRQPPCDLKVFQGASHFFHGRLTDLKAELAAHLAP